MTSVGAYMSRAPHTIGVEQSLGAARQLMSENRIRHLPVLHRGELVGMLSNREVASFEVLPGSSRLTVEEVMVPEVYVTVDDAPLAVVADEMARLYVGCAIVVAGDSSAKVLGVFTAVDALRALVDALRAQPASAR
jgi:acetoin utilization protein AcuB